MVSQATGTALPDTVFTGAALLAVGTSSAPGRACSKGTESAQQLELFCQL